MSATRSSGSSYSNSRGDIADPRVRSPVPYRVGPLQYSPAVLCECGLKAARWISWSDENPARRYFKCLNARTGGCEFYRWFDTEMRTEFLTEMLRDLRDAVWKLKKEKNELLQAVTQSSIKIDEERSQLVAARRELGKISVVVQDLKAKNASQRQRITSLKTQRIALGTLVIVLCLLLASKIKM
ncbi:hypothetical protein ACP70R_015776 [Stipagrostis hirtigluma subsp. patula]